ncbi:hypothetical protein ZPAH1_orf00365 [Aeromonas phage ZPAH1]|nr:hypothetical protein ASwh1_319 [Aeromonas phage Aswh_1]QQG34127.1 hypothetical protein ZPAH1_orf00365 [Aeromonas phage ZPAH1]
MIKTLHGVKNFAHMDASMDDVIRITLTNGKIMDYYSYYDSDLEMEIHGYCEKDNFGVGIESADIQDILNYEA